VFIDNGIVSNYTSVEEFVRESNSGLNLDVGEIYSDDINVRFFITIESKSLIISNNLAEIRLRTTSDVSTDAMNFYSKFGYIYPPFTQYKNVYLIVPYMAFSFKSNEITFSHRNFSIFPPNVDVSLHDSLGDFFSQNIEENFSVLISGGIDSSALLGFSNDKLQLGSAYMCDMSSIPKESQVANQQCESINLPFYLINLDKDLTHRAKEFMNETGELIYDPISVVFPELISQVCLADKKMHLIDGQGADSLLNGLPHNKLYNLWSKTKIIRPILKWFNYIPVYNSKSTPFQRKLYRVTKVLKCLSFESFESSLICSMTENDTPVTDMEKTFFHDLVFLNKSYDNWNFVLRFVFLFKILPVREMQKYLLANKYNVKFHLPLLDKKIVHEYLGLDESLTVKNGVYKYPITRMAHEYWPDFFKNSKTSPFQVNYKIANGDVKSFSSKYIREL